MNDDLLEKDDDGIEEETSWMITFTDMCMLLLVFFVVLLSFSNLDATKFKESFGSIKGAMGGDATAAPDVANNQENAQKFEAVKLRKQMIEAQKQAFNEIRSFLVENGMEGKLGAVFDNGVITLRLPASVLFAPHSADLQPGSEETLDILCQVFVQRLEQAVDIRGFTDDIPPPEGSRYRDNWELSAMRAVSVLRYMLDKGIDPVRLTATGFGSLNPVLMNSTDENRARNRRVEFMLHKRVTSGE